MKVSLNWLKEFLEINLSIEELAKKLSLHTIAVRELTNDYLEMDMKGYNRPDLLSLRGVALEISALTGARLKIDDPDNFIWDNQQLPELMVQIDNFESCPPYCLAKIEGLQVSESEPIWTHKLNDSGMRSVNNIADVTNLIMLDYGQPLHAFNASVVKDEEITVRLALDGETLQTLDGKSRQLQNTDLLITDKENILGIAGVMGGKDSEITDQTTTILLEAAIFDPILIRKTTTRLGLQSEASKRFQHGLTKKRLLQALNDAIKMYQKLGGKLTAISIVGNIQDIHTTINLSQNHVNSLMGIQLSEGRIESLLGQLRFELEKGNFGEWRVKIPYFRLDIEQEEDLIEEIVRMYGYQNIPSRSLPGEIPQPVDQSQFKLRDLIKFSLVEEGLTEVQTYSFFSTKVLSTLGWNKKLDDLVKIANPMSAETTYLRTNGWSNLLEVVDNNLKYGFPDIAIFELGKTYQQDEDLGIQERYELSVALVNNTDNPISELSQIIKALFVKLNLNISFTPSETPENEGDFFHPHRYIKLEFKGKQIGEIFEIHPRVLDQLGISKRVAVMDLELENLA